LTAFNSSFFRKVCHLPPFLAKAEIIGSLPHRSRQCGLSSTDVYFANRKTNQVEVPDRRVTDALEL
jgi:hypothetical protein